MTDRERSLRAVALALGALALCVGLFFVLMEPVTEVAPRGPQGLARTDPSYPARLTLEALGLRTSAHYGLGQLPPVDETIVLIGNGVEAQRALVDRLEPWVRAGGHLVLFPPERDLADLLAELQPDRSVEDADDAKNDDAENAAGDAKDDDPGDPADDAEDDAADDAEDDAADDAADPADAEEDAGDAEDEAWDDEDDAEDAEEEVDERQAELEAERARGGALWAAFGLWIDREPGLGGVLPERLTVTPPMQGDLQVSLPPGVSVSARRTALIWVAVPTEAPLAPTEAEPEDGPPHRRVAQRVRYGEGHVTAAVDERFLLLDALQQEPDGLRLLWSLLSLDRPPAAVRFVLQGGQGSIWTLPWRRAPLFVLALGLWGLAAALGLRSHFGPPLALDAPARRSLLEHIDGVGAFLWRRVGAGALLAPLRRRALRQLERSAPGLSEEPPELRNPRLAALSGLSEAELKLAFDVDLEDDRAGLLDQLRTLQKVDRLGRRGERSDLAPPSRPEEPSQ
jgi:hypothetical protein